MGKTAAGGTPCGSSLRHPYQHPAGRGATFTPRRQGYTVKTHLGSRNAITGGQASSGSLDFKSKMWTFYRTCRKSWSTPRCLQCSQGTLLLSATIRSGGLKHTTCSRLACSVDLIHIWKQGRLWEPSVFTVFEVHFKSLIPTPLKLINLAESVKDFISRHTKKWRWLTQLCWQ